MIHAHCMKTVMGGLSLILVLSACSSGSKSKTASAPPSGDMSRSDDMRRGATPTISPPIDLPRSDVVTDRGTSRRALPDQAERARLSDRSPEIAAACPSRADADGKVVFDDPTCPDRYRRQMGTAAAGDATGLATTCPSRVDANGKVIYDDPTCPDRYRRQTGTTAESGPAGLEAACPSRLDTNGKVIYNDPTCPDRYRRQAGAMSSIREARVRLSRAAASRYGTQRLVRARIITREWTHAVLRQSMRKAKWPTLMQAVPNGTAFRQRRMPFMTAMPIRQQSTPEQRRSPETKATCRI
jgi:hypothetical protein